MVMRWPSRADPRGRSGHSSGWRSRRRTPASRPRLPSRQPTRRRRSRRRAVRAAPRARTTRSRDAARVAHAQPGRRTGTRRRCRRHEPGLVRRAPRPGRARRRPARHRASARARRGPITDDVRVLLAVPRPSAMRGSARVVAARLLDAWLAGRRSRVAIGLNTWEGVEYLDRDRLRDLLSWAVRLDAIDAPDDRAAAAERPGSRCAWRTRPRRPATGVDRLRADSPPRPRRPAPRRPRRRRPRRPTKRPEAPSAAAGRRLPEKDPPQE